MKKKVCKGRGKFAGKGCGEEMYLFSHGLCKQCASKAYLDAQISTQKQNPTTDTKKQRKSLKSKRKPTGEANLFMELWRQRGGVSEVSGRKLLPVGHKFWHSQFAHVVSKGARPDLRLRPDNILLMTFDEHFKWDNQRHKLKGLPEWDFVFAKYEELRSVTN